MSMFDAPRCAAHAGRIVLWDAKESPTPKRPKSTPSATTL
jgi:hypothetical protein